MLGVGILTAAGFTAVFVARQASDDFSTASLSYAAFFGALFLAAHLVLRVRLPHADPYLLPLVGILTAVGLTLIYRIDPDLAFKQGLWVVVGVVAAAVLLAARLAARAAASGRRGHPANRMTPTRQRADHAG